jgi:metacaspase-1
MSYAFIKTMRSNPNQSYVNASPLGFHVLPFFNTEQVLQNTRQELESKYSQIPQLSVGGEYNLTQPVSVRLRGLFFAPVFSYPPFSVIFAPLFSKLY